MTIKDQTQFGRWSFSMINPENSSQFTIPIGGGYSKSLAELTNLVSEQMGEFDRVTSGEYTKKAREEAEKKNLSFPAYLSLLIQHQICVLNNNTVPCYSNGIGDDIHSLFKGLDGFVAKMPSPIRKAAEQLTKAITGGQKQFGGCQTCGGTRAFNPNANNLGRAGKLNK